ncbi:noncanonical pyrimidine nucleotidase, YjjG family [Polaribacter aestuariivivens]|uniref:Noncanonical pyrimidine nucleotidase, YjjG family n=1 Tax=Polaribacter aestuariivivens TaxID=2304626 RepID=A0A5S3N805_9FLAO|nr:YjjG family noncanonical pyrimidine nucleotidase [Polaribacter aestuariivivens]TMM29499.1 noncanonical pyrimidine nucleotidase, YjjG family [Polaribacter aestuariivivens]
MKIEHVFFDLDHTLWDFEKNSELTFHKIFADNGIAITLQDFLEVYKPLNLEYWKLYREEKISKKALRYERLKKTFDAVNYTISDDLIDKIAIEYIDNLANFNHLFDGTFELLDYLKEKYTLHIITNGFEEIQSKKMMNSKIHHYFDKIITSDSVGVKKPNPKIFNYALESAKATKESSIMIGDSLEADVQGALNIGLKAIHCNFNNTISTNKNILSVTSLLELKQYL